MTKYIIKNVRIIGTTSSGKGKELGLVLNKNNGKDMTKMPTGNALLRCCLSITSSITD